MRPRLPFLALALLSFGLATAAPWKNEAMRVKINLPGTWKQVTVKMADTRLKAAKDSNDIVYYRALKEHTAKGNFFIFEEKPKGGARADLQSAPLGKPLRVMTEQDIRNLCPMWAAKHDENEMPFLDCQPRKLGIAWTAFLTYQPEPDTFEYQIKYFRPDGTLILFTVTGTAKQAEVIFKSTKFY